ncbi:CBS domain-containing protein CBSX3 [Hibiscus syriacus]|uniref:CBS domain-containing protein CBSX3 n=1 Tax=Hibiscus syriacus TaxID=106335 RepID=A0A6A3CUY6_HIBSY|nr:CBS domain-containing protein CBSX3, mitochondrial-like [Hibiscus syriacus]KAE8732284.1 CBS domain-containing protein CBSX3 [Hibiscus syriacus]
MQRSVQAFSVHGNTVKNAVLHCIRVVNQVMRPVMFSRCFESQRRFESTTISDVLKAKGKAADDSWLWCTTDDTVYDAVKSMTQQNVGSLVVVKPGEHKSIVGIITERGRSSNSFCSAKTIKHHDWRYWVFQVRREHGHQQQRAWALAWDAPAVKADKDCCCLRGKEGKIFGVLLSCWGCS